jgi:SNF2 family DNA or RNA helicase
VVCPTSVLSQWEQQLAKHLTAQSNLRIYVYHGNKRFDGLPPFLS